MRDRSKVLKSSVGYISSIEDSREIGGRILILTLPLNFIFTASVFLFLFFFSLKPVVWSLSSFDKT